MLEQLTILKEKLEKVGKHTGSLALFGEGTPSFYEIPFLFRRKRFFISMGVSKLCHFKGEHSLVDYVYNAQVNI